jgi:hypothetical protein
MPKRSLFCAACGGLIGGLVCLRSIDDEELFYCEPCCRALEAAERSLHTLLVDPTGARTRAARRLRLAKLALLARAILVEWRGWGAWLQ